MTTRAKGVKIRRGRILFCIQYLKCIANSILFHGLINKLSFVIYIHIALKLKQIKPLGKENSITLIIVHLFTDYIIILNDPFQNLQISYVFSSVQCFALVLYIFFCSTPSLGKANRNFITAFSSFFFFISHYQQIITR